MLSLFFVTSVVVVVVIVAAADVDDVAVAGLIVYSLLLHPIEYTHRHRAENARSVQLGSI